MSRQPTAPPPAAPGLRVSRWPPVIGILLGALLALVWYLHTEPSSPAPGRPAPAEMAAPSPAPAPAANAPERLTLKVLSVRPHDPEAFTQGLLIDHGTMFESTGLNGKSTLREVDPKTGAVKRKIDVPQQFFAEGLALVGDRLIQLTWQEGKALVYDRATFQKTGELPYQGEGWGLCWDGTRLIMSDGSDRLTFRDPQTFAVVGGVAVTVGGRPAYQLNELECVGGLVYANVWQNDDILRIDPKDGRVTAVIDAAGLLTREERLKTDVLNGIAWDPDSRSFFVTGKLWPKMFQVQLVPAR
jgi:glutaminyl-peptide cyclotransferase